MCSSFKCLQYLKNIKKYIYKASGVVSNDYDNDKLNETDI